LVRHAEHLVCRSSPAGNDGDGATLTAAVPRFHGTSDTDRRSTLRRRPVGPATPPARPRDEPPKGSNGASTCCRGRSPVSARRSVDAGTNWWLWGERPIAHASGSTSRVRRTR
jgi:hypothetical protein